MEKIDLTKILKVGDEVYSALLGRTVSIISFNTGSDTEYPIKADNLHFSKYGQYLIDGECMIFPSKTERDWSNYSKEKERLTRIEEAKLKYPIGTKIQPAHIKTTNKSYIQQVKSHEIKEYFEPYCLCFKGVTTNWLTCVYSAENGWAEIVKKPLFTTEDGVDVYGEEYVWYFNKQYSDSSIFKTLSRNARFNEYKNLVYFSSEKVAKDWKVKFPKKKSEFTPEQREEIIRLIKENK